MGRGLLCQIHEEVDHGRAGGVAQVEHFVQFASSLLVHLLHHALEVQLPQHLQTLLDLLYLPQETEYFLVVHHHLGGKQHL